MTETNRRFILTGMQILSERKWLKDHAVLVENSHIKAILPEHMISHHLPAKIHKFSEDHYLLPGFIDLHVHGVNGKDVMDGTEDALISICHGLAEEGVTGFLATTMTAENEQIEAVLEAVAKSISYPEGAAILGVHLEGPFISTMKRGAQPKHEKMPDPNLIQKWQVAAQGAIKLVTLAPELPGSLELIKTLRKLDIVASIGHTDATYEETLQAIAAGCTQATHLFNAMSGLHQRKPGAVSALLLSDLVRTEVIVDGIHLHPAIVDLTFRLKHKEGMLLVTDAIRAKCLGNGQYELGGQLVNVVEGEAKLADGTIAGSTLRMPEAIKNMVKFSHCSLIDAIEMATLNPARALGLTRQKGEIDKGMDADLVVLNAELEVVLTIRAGQIVFPRS